MKGEKNLIDKDKVSLARKAFKRYFRIYIYCYAWVFFMIPIAYIKNETIVTIFAIPFLIIMLAWFVLRVVLIFRIRYICKPMGKSWATISLYQLGIIAIPFGDIIFPAIILNESNKVILT